MNTVKRAHLCRLAHVTGSVMASLDRDDLSEARRFAFALVTVLSAWLFVAVVVVVEVV